MGNQAEPGALRRITPHRGLREGRVTEPAWAGGEGRRPSWRKPSNWTGWKWNASGVSCNRWDAERSRGPHL